MNPEQFIKNNVVKALLTDGYSAEQAEQGGGRLFHTTGAHLNQQPSAGISLMTAWTKPERFSSTTKRKAPGKKEL